LNSLFGDDSRIVHRCCDLNVLTILLIALEGSQLARASPSILGKRNRKEK
jgi:hypothetical protein